MNKYQWMRKQRRNKKNYFKSFLILVLIVGIAFLILKGCQSIAEDFWDKVKEKTLDAAAGIVTDTFTINDFYENYENEAADYGTTSVVMHDFFPVGEMYMREYVDLPSDTDTPEYVADGTESETLSEKENGTDEETESASSLGNGASEQDESGEKQTTENPSQGDEDTSASSDDTKQDNSSEGNTSDSQIIAAAAGVYSMNNLLDYNYVLNNFYVVPSVTSLRPQVLDLEKITSVNLTIEKDPSVPQILIFHTHSQEKFADSDQNGKSIVDVGEYLTELLRDKYGYNVIHLTDTFDIAGGVLDRSEAYTYANAKLNEVLAQNPSIQVVIDLHRDGVDASKHLVTTINGKQTAKVMLFNGVSYTKEQGDIDYLYNPYLTENLAMTYKMYLLGAVNYPDFFRCIYISGYRYCLHHVPRSMLIEAGAQTNTYEEVYNAMEPLAELLDKELTIN